MVLATFEKQFSRPVYLSTANHCLSIQESINEKNVSNKDSNTTFIKKTWCDCDVKGDASAKLLFSWLNLLPFLRSCYLHRRRTFKSLK